MNKPILVAIFTIIFYTTAAYAQTKVFKGTVYDAQFKTAVPYAAVFIEGTAYGVIADNLGRFHFIAPNSSKHPNIVVSGKDFNLKRIPIDSVDTENLVVFIDNAMPSPSEQLVENVLPHPEKPFFKFVGKAATMILDDWLPIGNKEVNKFDFGRIQTIPAYNPVEGVRLRLGVASNARFNKRFFIKAYSSYGFRDKKFKYRSELVWSFTDKVYSDEEFPKNNLRFVAEEDIYAPGEMHPRALNDALLVSYRRSKNETTYRHFNELNYEKENARGPAYLIWFRRSDFQPQGDLQFISRLNNQQAVYEHLTNTEAGISLHYSPREAYIQQKRKRIPIDINSPFVSFTYTKGIKNVLGGQFSYHRTDFSVQKRFRVFHSSRLDMIGEFSKIWNTVPFPLLVFPNQRMRHNIENNPFFLNRSMEFLADWQTTFRATFVGSGHIFSNIPFAKALGMREVVNVRAVYGGLSHKNMQYGNESFLFPTSSYTYQNAPYVEAAVGLTNILGVVRAEYVHRFTYRHHADALRYGFRLDVVL